MTVATMAIRKGRKFDQVLDGARQVFLTDGFEGASVDEIARAANVSKATLYSYFPDKRLLFMEVATTECQRQARDAQVTRQNTDGVSGRGKVKRPSGPGLKSRTCSTAPGRSGPYIWGKSWPHS